MTLFDLPGFAGGPTVSPPSEPRAPAPMCPAAAGDLDFEVTGDIRDHSWDDLPTAQPGHPTSLWGNPERAAALWGPITATDPVLGADTTTEAGTVCIEKHTSYHEIEKHSTAEYSTSFTIEIKANP
ncbi:hypothetical protein [Nocardia sp. NPDC046763]|uniref:hypothetical protein n=1 Tax=Nocardia sp. NPDC046763 TaxID=3155256 RepID=UPI003408FB1D